MTVLNRRAVMILVAMLPLRLVAYGPCGHCDAPTPKACHRGDRHSADPGNAGHERAPQLPSACDCPAHHLCGVLSGGAVSAAVPSSESATGAGPVTILALRALPAIGAKALRRAGGRASPPYRSTPLYLATQSLLI